MSEEATPKKRSRRKSTKKDPRKVALETVIIEPADPIVEEAPVVEATGVEIPEVVEAEVVAPEEGVYRSFRQRRSLKRNRL